MKRLVIDLGAVKENIGAVKKRAESAVIIADLSCDAQGLGLIKIASLLREEGITSFAVSEVEEAEKLRKNGFVDETILMLRSTVDISEIERLCDCGAILTIGSYDAGIAINSVAESRKTAVEAQVKVDSGIGQHGFIPTELDKMINIFHHMPGVAVSGIYTRFSGVKAGKALIQKQLATFENVLVRLNESGVDTGIAHALDSYALFKCDMDKLDAVCVGSAISGRTPGVDKNELTKVGYIEADIDELYWLPAATVVGIGKGVKLKKSTKLAVVSVGWTNGVGLVSQSAQRRGIKAFFAGAERPNIKAGGKKVKIVGEIGASCILLDLTEVECGVGDKVFIEADPRIIKGIPVEYR